MSRLTFKEASEHLDLKRLWKKGALPRHQLIRLGHLDHLSTLPDLPREDPLLAGLPVEEEGEK
jgi:hypothetical protein